METNNTRCEYRFFNGTRCLNQSTSKFRHDFGYTVLSCEKHRSHYASLSLREAPLNCSCCGESTADCICDGRQVCCRN